MQGKKIKLLVPQYMNKFSCIGPACEDNCCIGWKVIIDNKTYKKYKTSSDEELKEIFEKKVTRNRANASDGSYAKIKMETNGFCPFLNEEKLCRVQKNLGAAYLSETCAFYPRIVNKVNGVFEISATMSCPEAARLALLNEKPMEFDMKDDVVERDFIVLDTIDTHDISAFNKPGKYFWELRMFTIDLLQNRKYKLADRLTLLGMFYSKLRDYVSEGRTHDIAMLIAQYTNKISEGIFDEGLKEIPVNNTIQMQILKEIADEKIFQGVTGDRFLQCFAEFVNGIGYTADAVIEDIGKKYKECYDKYYDPILSKHEYILENYLVNYVFKDMFPVIGQKDLFGNYIMLVIHYSMIKMMLIGISGIYKERFDEEQIVRLVQSFAKAVGHNKTYLNNVYKILKDNNFTTMAYMAIFIKN